MNEEKQLSSRRQDRASTGIADTVPSQPRTQQTDAPEIKKGSIDYIFLLITAALVLFGCVMIYSASSVFAEQHHAEHTYFISRHLFFLLAAAGATALVVCFCTYRVWEDAGYVLYAVSVVLLLLVLVVGVDLNSGAKRWLDFKIFTIQPSELAKLALILCLAKFFSSHQKQVLSEHRFGGNFKYGVLYPGLMIGLFVVLIAAERHISGIMIVGMIGLSVMFLGGTRLKWIFMIIGMLGCAACLLILVSEYAQARVETWLFLDKADPLGSAWQTLQGLMAIGSGGFFGKGLGNSQQKFGFVSQPQNDQIFTIVCEELGFVGAFLVIGLFALFLWRGFRIAKHAPTKCTSLIAYGLTFKVALQVAMNIAVVTNSMPNTGISLPFFSYGGTSFMLQIFEVGILLSISRYSTHQKI
ncbi:MAG: cell division protein FtsW [Clostridia bacterium]|nr:cell division protein FtsW [Clostridia bacterium]MBR2927007.1 cell division protein FtsW [Clostridia bacterium]